MQESTLISGAWRFLPDIYGEGESFGWHTGGIDDSSWWEVDVPCTFDQCGEELETHEGVGWFRRTVDVPQEWQGNRVTLHFGAANMNARVWVNGKLAGENHCGFLPFEFQVDELVEFGEQNTIVVWVDNTKLQTDVPGKLWGWRNFGGIIRDVHLNVSDPLHLQDIVISAEPTADGGALDVRCVAVNQRSEALDVVLEVRALDSDDNLLAEAQSEVALIAAASSSALELSCGVPQALPWSPDSPSLYTVEMQLKVDDQVVARDIRRTGFRTVSTDECQVLLNEQPIFMTGFNRHEDTVESGLVRNTEVARRDFVDMKQSGCNFVRLCHYPHDEAELDLCDELGLLVMCEIPLYWWRGHSEVDEEQSNQKLQAARQQLERLIARDRNHPCVVFWSVSNECTEDAKEVREGIAELCRLAKELDPSRLAVHASCYHKTDPSFDEDDVICINDYPGWGHGQCDLDDDGRHFSKATEFWRRELTKLHELYPHKPILIAEFGHPSILGQRKVGLGEDTQARALVAEFEAMKEPYMCGALIWCYADHAWPAGSPFVGSMTTSPYGVQTRSRIKKSACASIKKMFIEAQDARGGS